MFENLYRANDIVRRLQTMYASLGRVKLSPLVSNGLNASLTENIDLKGLLAIYTVNIIE